MLIAFNIIILVFLLVIIAQDFIYRKISWILLPLLFTSFLIKAILLIPFSELIIYVVYNFTFTALYTILMFAYISIKKGKFFNIINTYLGIADLLFFVVICVAFSTINLMVFVFFSGVFSIFISILYISFKRLVLKKETKKEIPFAGLMSLALVIILVWSFFDKRIHFYNDDFVAAHLLLY